MREIIIREEIKGWNKKEIKEFFDYIWEQDILVKRIIIDKDHFEVIYIQLSNEKPMFEPYINPSRRKKK